VTAHGQLRAICWLAFALHISIVAIAAYLWLTSHVGKSTVEALFGMFLLLSPPFMLVMPIWFLVANWRYIAERWMIRGGFVAFAASPIVWPAAFYLWQVF